MQFHGCTVWINLPGRDVFPEPSPARGPGEAGQRPSRLSRHRGSWKAAGAGRGCLAGLTCPAGPAPDPPAAGSIRAGTRGGSAGLAGFGWLSSWTMCSQPRGARSPANCRWLHEVDTNIAKLRSARAESGHVKHYSLSSCLQLFQ